MSVALLFPGQGAQQAGLLHRLPAHPVVQETLDEASATLGHDVLELDSAPALAASQAVQLSILIAGVAVARALCNEGLTVQATAGLSVGAFAAAVLCESLQFADALRLVRLRGEQMDRAFGHGYGMVVLAGLDESQVRALVQRAGGERAQVYLANINAPRQLVVTGADAALQVVMASARTAGARRAERLAVSVPSHCALLEPVADALAEAMRSVEVRVPRFAYVSNERGRVVRSAEAIRDDLTYNVARTVRWADGIAVLYELGVRLFIELPPGQVLSDLARAEFPESRAVSVERMQVDSVLSLARKV